jgi:TRAP-type C4-dicarboxylate transport system permease small subunit
VERIYAGWRTFQDRILGRAAALLLLGCTLLALLEVVRRYIFGQSFEWQQDAVTFFTMSAVFLYFGLSQRRDDHLCVMVVPELLAAGGPRGKQLGIVLKLVALVLSFQFLLAVVYWGIPEVRESLHYGSRTESLAFPMWPFLAVLLVSFLFLALTVAFQIYREVQKLRGMTVLEDPPEDGDPAH